MIVEFDPAVSAAIQAIYDDPRRTLLANRLEDVIEELEAGPPYSARVRGRRMQSPKLWYVPVHGNGEVFALLWDEIDDNDVRIHWAGPGI